MSQTVLSGESFLRPTQIPQVQRSNNTDTDGDTDTDTDTDTYRGEGLDSFSCI